MSEYSYEKKFDVVIVGAGVVGCAIAYYLARRSGGHLKIGVIERNTIGQEASSGAAGMLAAQIETESNSAFLNLALQSRGLFESLSQELKALSGRDIEFENSGIAATAFSAGQEAVLKKRMDWQKKIGLECEWLSSEQTMAKFPFLKKESQGTFWVPQDGQVSAGNLTLAFAEAAKKLGVEFFEYESFDHIDLETPGLKFVETAVSQFTADQFVFCVGAWTGKLLNPLAPVHPVKGQILFFDIPAKWREKYAWNTPIYLGETTGSESISCYLVPKKDGQLLLGATMENRDFDKSENKQASKEMMCFACDIFPELKSFPFKGTWVGLRPASADGMPVLGLLPGFSNVYAASGHFRNGILLSPITGQLMAELILDGKTSISLDPFSPARFGMRQRHPINGV